MFSPKIGNNARISTLLLFNNRLKIPIASAPEQEEKQDIKGKRKENEPDYV